MYKKLAPYSKPLHEAQIKGDIPTNDIYIWIGEKAWHKGMAFCNSNPTRNITIPPWHDPQLYFYPVEKCDCLIFDTGWSDLDYVKDLAIELFKAGANKVRFVCPDSTLTIFHKE